MSIFGLGMYILTSPSEKKTQSWYSLKTDVTAEITFLATQTEEELHQMVKDLILGKD